MLFGNQTYRRDIAEQHQSLALRAYSSLDFCGSDQRLKWRHLASLGWAGARHSQSPVKKPHPDGDGVSLHLLRLGVDGFFYFSYSHRSDRNCTRCLCGQWSVLFGCGYAASKFCRFAITGPKFRTPDRSYTFAAALSAPTVYYRSLEPKVFQQALAEQSTAAKSRIHFLLLLFQKRSSPPAAEGSGLSSPCRWCVRQEEHRQP
jgi:hypothetical protein